MLDQKGFTPIILITGFVILVGLIGGGFFYYQSLPHELSSTTVAEQEIKENTALDEGYQEPAKSVSSSGTPTSPAEGSGAWINYDDKLIEFSYPKDKPFRSFTDTNNEPSRFFEFPGNEKSIAMFISKESIDDVRETSNKIYKGDISPKVMAEKSRNYSLESPSSESKNTTEIKEITVDGKAGYYYDFQDSYPYPLGGGGTSAFLIEKGCNSRAIFVNSDNGVYNIVYCMRQPFEDIYKSIKLK